MKPHCGQTLLFSLSLLRLVPSSKINKTEPELFRFGQLNKLRKVEKQAQCFVKNDVKRIHFRFPVFKCHGVSSS